MIYNELLSKQYGIFTEIGKSSNIPKNKPTPTETDYSNGYIDRFFVKKANENIIFEISYSSAVYINTNLYKPVQVKWKISGPKNDVYKNNVFG